MQGQPPDSVADRSIINSAWEGSPMLQPRLRLFQTSYRPAQARDQLKGTVLVRDRSQQVQS